MAYYPNNPNGQATMANSSPVAIASNQSAIPSYIASSAGTAVTIRPDSELRVAIDASSLLYDTFESTLDTTNRWTAAGTTPTSGGGNLTVSAGTTALAFSSLTSQPTFALLGNMFNQTVSLITVDSGLKTGTYRFFGLGVSAGSPTVAAPIVNGVGFEWLDTTGVLSGVVWSNGVKTQTISLSGVQPTDGAIHRYQVYFKSSRAYFEIDNVSVGSISYPNPQVTTLPILSLVVNGASTVSPAAVYTSSFIGLGDSSANNKFISDATFPWRKASVSSTGALSITSAGIPASLGQMTMAGSQPVAIASDQTNLPTAMPDMYVTGAATQTATVNNILTNPSGTAATDGAGYRAASVQVVSTGTGGTFIFEGSNDNVNFQAVPVYSNLILTGTPIVAAITASASQLIYTFPMNFRYVRLRIATTITGGSIQAFTRMSQAAWTPAVFQVAQSTAANLATSATIASGTVTTVSTVTSVTAVAAINSVATTNGLSIGTVVTAATPATTSIKGTAGRLYNISVGNPNATAVYLKIFNVAAPTLGTTAANLNYLIPATSQTTIPINDIGLFFSTAIVIAVTGAIALTDNTAITSGCAVSYSWI